MSIISPELLTDCVCKFSNFISLPRIGLENTYFDSITIFKAFSYCLDEIFCQALLAELKSHKSALHFKEQIPEE